MIRRILLLQLFVLVTLFAAGQERAAAIRRALQDATSTQVLVASHRAAHHQHPENSLPAIQAAIDLGVDIVEIDVKVSKDGIPFLMHDRTMDRTTTGKGDPEVFTWEELQQFHIVDKGRRTALRIPRLEDALRLAEGKIMVDLDLKTDRIEAITRVIEKTGTKDIVLFFDSDYTVLSHVRQLDEDFMIMPRAYSTLSADSAIMLFDPPVVHIDFNFYSPECIRLIQGSSARAWINALGPYDADLRAGKARRALKKLVGNGATIIQTDEPRLLLAALKKYGYRHDVSYPVLK